MRIYILGICGTFMAGIAVIAKQLGHEVVGSDANVYPPMSDQLAAQGIHLLEGYDPAHLKIAKPDCVIIGNALSRGNPLVEAVLREGLVYTSGPQWLAEQVLATRWVLAVAGTHGKTTTSSMLAWILESAGLNPGFLIGGIPKNFSISARITASPFFVIEADEYDSAFFDKRSKFIHYRPKTAILNNLEYDHADIFPDLEAIKKQFQFFIRTIPDNGLIVCPTEEAGNIYQEQNLADVLKRGCWTPVQYFDIKSDISPSSPRIQATEWLASDISSDGSAFTVCHKEREVGRIQWNLLGLHNVNNALAAIAAAHHVGVEVNEAIRSLESFQNVKRRLEVRGQHNGIMVYDDFAHHPTAIATTLAGLRGKIGTKERIVAVLELASNTMQAGVHKHDLAPALKEADLVFIAKPNGPDWGIEEAIAPITCPVGIYADANAIVTAVTPQLTAGDHIIVMSNKGFDGIHTKLLAALKG